MLEACDVELLNVVVEFVLVLGPVLVLLLVLECEVDVDNEVVGGAVEL